MTFNPDLKGPVYSYGQNVGTDKGKLLPTVETRSIKIRVFIEGFEVTARFSSITGVRYTLNNPGTCTITLECPNDDFVTTQDDCIVIDNWRLSRGHSDFRFENDDLGYKAFYLGRFAKMKVPQWVTDLAEETHIQLPTPWLYTYGVYSNIIPLSANVRVFIEFEGVWYHLFTGAVASRSFTRTLNDRNYITLHCLDALYFLRRNSLLNSSMGVYESAAFQKISNLTLLPGNPLQPNADIAGGAGFASVGTSMNKFSLPGRDFIGALVFSIYGDVNPWNAYTVETNSSPYGNSLNSLFPLTLKYFDTESGDSNNKISVYRNAFNCGHFNLANMVIGVSGGSSDDLYNTIKEGEWGQYVKKYANPTDWESVTDNVVVPSDLLTLSALEQTDTLAYLSQVSHISDLDSVPPEKVINILGFNTRSDGIYSASSGALKVLLPGNVSGAALDALKPTEFEIPSVEKFSDTKRIDVLRHFVSERSDFVFYATPKGDIVVEFPMFDQPFFGSPDPPSNNPSMGNSSPVSPNTGQAWRSYNKSEWTGAYSDMLDEDSLANMAQAGWYLPGTTRTVLDGQCWGVLNPLGIQASIIFTLLVKLGFKRITGDPMEYLFPVSADMAQDKANLILSRTNREHYNGSIGLRFQPRFMLNRNLELLDVGRAGVVKDINMGLVKDTTPTFSISLGYIREWNGLTLKAGKRVYDVAFGEVLRNICIDYGKYFVDGTQVQPDEEPPVSVVGICRPAGAVTAGAMTSFLNSDYSPIDPADHVHISQEFGPNHHGIDIAAELGTPIMSPYAGRVYHVRVWNGDTTSSYGKSGNYVTVKTANGAIIKFCHLRDAPVYQQNDPIAVGDIIGFVGMTGKTTGPHLHYETWANERTVVDPSLFTG